jgi:hypothetical protein
VTSSTSTAILASDFSQSTADTLRTRWSVAKMSHAILALAGAPVVITPEKRTGFSLVGVELVKAYHDSLGGDRVQVKTTFTDGTEQLTNYRLVEFGEAIIPLTQNNAKWTALKTYRDQVSHAIRIAASAHGEAEGRAWGAWKGTPLSLTEVDVTYTPHTGNDFYADKWGTRWYGRINTPAPATV